MMRNTEKNTDMDKQKLSELIDGELSGQAREAAIDALLADTAAQRSWQKLHFLREAVQNKIVAAPQQSIDFSDKFAQALQDEPAIMAPNHLKAVLNVESAELNQQPADKAADKIVPINSRRAKAFGVFAIAASAVLVAVLNIAPTHDNSVGSAGVAASDAVNQNRINMEQALQSMVVQHGEFSGAAALNGLVSYAKVVNGSTQVAAQGNIQ